jgi:DNA-binding winged helix-turn-helix (wHTH) protein
MAEDRNWSQAITGSRRSPMQAKHQEPIDRAATRGRADRLIALSKVNQGRMNSDCDGVIRFGRFRVLRRQRQLIADGVPVELGTRAFEILLVLLEADGALVTKDELFGRAWPGMVVAEANLKVQISALRRALGEDRGYIRTEFGRGYRFTAPVSLPAWRAHRRPMQRRHRSSQRSSPQRPHLDW